MDIDTQHKDNPKVEQPSQTSTWKAVVKEIFIFAVIAFGVVLPFRMYIAEPYIVSGTSMDPTFATGNYLIVDKISSTAKHPPRNAVIVFEFPLPIKGEEGKNLIKRVIGIPGDTVTMSNNVITITNAENPNGFVLEQPYLVYPAQSLFTVTLKADEYFVMGDNRPVSYDSRAWGVLPARFIVGRPLVQLYPFSDMGIWPGMSSLRK
jgi:signal peptidase I